MTAPLLLSKLERIASASDFVERLRPLIIATALKGRLTLPVGAPAISAESITSGMRELVAGRRKYRWKPDPISPSLPSDAAPEGWTKTSLNSTGLFINGLTFKPTDWNSDGRPIIRIQNLSGKSVDFNRTHRAVPSDLVIKDGDLLVSWSATLDTFLWRGPDGVLNQHILKVIPNVAAVKPDYLYWLLKHEVRQLAQSQHAHGLAMMHINRGPFLAHGVFLPPFEEQERIVSRIDELMALCDDVTAIETERESQRDRLRTTSLRYLVASDESREAAPFFISHSPQVIKKPEHVDGVRQAILELAMRGRLVPQNPEDGQGRHLLHVIANERKMVTTRATMSFVPPPDPLPQIPPNWDWASIDDIAACEANAITDGPFGANLKTVHYIGQSGFRVIRLGNIGHGTFRSGLHTYIAKSNWERLNKHHVFEGDLVVAGLVDPSVRACELPPGLGPALVKADCYRFHVHPRFSTRFALYFLNSAVCQEFAAIHHHGMTLTRLGLGNFRRLPIPVPPFNEQYRIVTKVDELMAVCDELEQSLATEQTERTQLLQALLQNALRKGEAEKLESL